MLFTNLVETSEVIGDVHNVIFMCELNNFFYFSWLLL